MPDYFYEGFLFNQRAGAPAPSFLCFAAPAQEVVVWAEAEPLGPESWGPQRSQSDSRVRAISNYLNSDNRNTIPTAIILAFDAAYVNVEDLEDPLPRPGIKCVRINVLAAPDGRYRAASILDGQHRLAGVCAYAGEMLVPVVALFGADRVEQAFQFLVINNKATRVPSAHTKALLARLKDTDLSKRLQGARIGLNAQDISDVALVNSDTESPFYQHVDWPTTPEPQRLVQATAIESSLNYVEGLRVPEFADSDVRRAFFLTLWREVKKTWPALWREKSRLISKVGIIVLTQYLADTLAKWADSEDIELILTDESQVTEHVGKILKYMDPLFWEAPWVEGGYDTQQGRQRIYAGLETLYRNGRRGNDWYDDIGFIDQSDVDRLRPP